MKSLIHNSSDYNRHKDDMASALEMTHDFNNNDYESFLIWTTKLTALQKIYNLQDNMIIQIINKKLKGEIHDYFLEYIANTKIINVQQIYKTLHDKFHYGRNQKYCDFLLSTEEIKTKEELQQRLNEAKHLLSAKILEPVTIRNILVNKIPHKLLKMKKDYIKQPTYTEMKN
ncbi:hypothetical protein BDAP_001266 [Binucleata daphniae]